ncbi:unannotated protein [freshwater metagenome]|uniref:Unannotated protein n=1 Tax=freshwater metagenome TaxID=449393 RepID=A0A6J6JXS7_9ZZZZ
MDQEHEPRAPFLAMPERGPKLAAALPLEL